MCGIAGLWQSRPTPEGQPTLRAMTDAIAHRGPDDSGYWYDRTTGVGLGHRRLSILDLSVEGHQPMKSPSGRYMMVFNGEVYNFGEVRADLDREGALPPLRGHSDTEIMLAAFEHWGLIAAVRRFNGMFAFALWDERERALHLVRDRLGIKPVFYGFTANGIVFGSELKSLTTDPEFRRDIDRESVASYFRFNRVPAPGSIYQAARKLQPGMIATFRSPTATSPELTTYWDSRALTAGANPFNGTEAEAEEALDALLRDAVRLQMLADVPLGAFLSGGIDSSTVVALMQAQSGRPVQTFSIGNEDSRYDEGAAAAAVAAHLGTDHTALVVTAEMGLGVIPNLPQMYDEPFSDSSQIPTFLVSQLARKSVTVSLSGDGGDELFGGYNRYFWGPRIWNALRWAPPSLRAAIARSVTRVSPSRWDRVFQLAGPLAPQITIAGQQVHKLAGLFGVRSEDEFYLKLCTHWADPNSVVKVAGSLPRPPPPGQDFAHRMMYEDLITYLPDDILTKVDRASMAVALEARVPLLDHRVAEFAWRLPAAYKIQGGVGKRVLRRVLERYVPRSLFDRPKAGFGIPIGEWLRGPLRPWADALLDPQRIREQGFLNPAVVATTWQEHLSGRLDWQHRLWDVLMFQAWVEAHHPRAQA